MDNGQFSKAAVGFSALSWGKQIGILIGLALSIAMGFYIVLWSKTPDLAPLYAQLDSKDASLVMDNLQKMGVEHKFDAAQGGVLVPMAKINEVRMRLASLGIPKNSEVGFELLEQNNRLGGSQMLDAVRYKRGLEGELSRTIAGLDAVRNARVHLGMPREATFLKSSQKSTASVMLDLYPGQQLEPQQVLGIVHLVASSVPGLNKESVTVVDQTGRLLNQGGGNMGQMAVAGEQFNYTRQLESTYSRRVQELLTPILGPNSVRAETTVEMDFTVSEETEEKFNPKKVAVKNESLLSEKRGAGIGLEGVPGALSNQPPSAGTAPEQAPAATPPAPEAGAGGQAQARASTSPESSRSQVNKNYEVDKSISHVKQSVGKLTRLTVAVLVDDKISYDAEGKEQRTKLTEDELKNIKELVQSAVGFNKERGDVVSVINSSFAQAPPVLPPEQLKLWQQAWFIPLVKQILGGIFVLLVLFMVIRPLLKNLAVASGNSGGMGSELPMAGGAPIQLEGPNNSMRQLSSESGTQAKEPIDKVKQLVQDDSKKVANVVMNWVGKEEE
ncbi:MAG: flagellar basal-body MS-ring/collar protein FliF [Gammaproteobacteria bacterium]